MGVDGYKIRRPSASTPATMRSWQDQTYNLTPVHEEVVSIFQVHDTQFTMKYLTIAPRPTLVDIAIQNNVKERGKRTSSNIQRLEKNNLDYLEQKGKKRKRKKE